jgi:hypothetical protein
MIKINIPKTNQKVTDINKLLGREFKETQYFKETQ